MEKSWAKFDNQLARCWCFSGKEAVPQLHTQHCGLNVSSHTLCVNPETKESENMPIDAALIVCGLTNNAGNAKATAVAAFEHEGMANVADFAHMNDKDVIEMCEAMNSRALNQNGHQIGALKI